MSFEVFFGMLLIISFRGKKYFYWPFFELMKFAHTTGPCLSHQHIILKPDASELVITLLPCEGCQVPAVRLKASSLQLSTMSYISFCSGVMIWWWVWLWRVSPFWERMVVNDTPQSFESVTPSICPTISCSRTPGLQPLRPSSQAAVCACLNKHLRWT